MVDRDAVRRAMDELYSVEPEQFLPRRSALAAAARSAGDRATAKEITGLRKPTRSAAILNGLARSEPDRVDALLELGTDLRDAERSVDARRLRDLTGRRRKLIDDLTREAFRIAGDEDPSSTIRDEVVSTITAALADDDVAEQLHRGTLVKPARWEGFGFGGGPDLMVVPAIQDGHEDTEPVARKAVSGRARTARSGSPDDTEPGSTPADDGGQRQEREQARRDAQARAEQDRRESIADARRVADEADAAVAEAREAEQEQHDRLRMLEEQVVDARRRLDDARLAVRRAEVRQRKAAHALSRVDR